MKRSGFTTIELAIVLVLIGLIAAFGFPKIRDALDASNVRSARAAVTTLVVTARAAAVQRGCLAVFHVSSASGGTVWVTACPRLRPGAGTVDTVSGVEQLGVRYNVTVSSSRDSVRYDPRGLSVESVQTAVALLGGTGKQDTVFINSLGKVVR